MQHGGAGPWWLPYLIAAEAWGTPPWVLAGDEPSAAWLMRFAEYRHQLNNRDNPGRTYEPGWEP